VTGKPTTEDLGIDPDAQAWQRSGEGDGAIEVAFVRAAAGSGGSGGSGGSAEPGGSSGSAEPGGSGAAESRGSGAAPGDWVLMRVAGDPARRVLVFDRHEWECFLDGARNGEFDDAAAN
jgi:hypothetical protein